MEEIQKDENLFGKSKKDLELINFIKKNKQLDKHLFLKFGKLLSKSDNEDKHTKSNQELEYKGTKTALKSFGFSTALVGGATIFNIDIPVLSNVVDYASHAAFLLGDNIVDFINMGAAKINSMTEIEFLKNIFSPESLKHTIQSFSADLTSHYVDAFKEEPDSLANYLKLKVSVGLGNFVQTSDIDYSKIVSGLLLIHVGSKNFYTDSYMPQKQTEYNIAKYADDLLEPVNRTQDSLRTLDAIKTEKFFRGAANNKTFGVGNFISNGLIGLYRHAKSPVETTQKAWIASNIGVNNFIKFFTNKENINQIKKLKNKNEGLKERYKTKVSHNRDVINALDKIKNSNFYSIKNENEKENIKPISILQEAAELSHNDLLKVNVKNALAKSLYVMGSNTSQKKKKEAIKYLKKISQLHNHTVDNRFDHYSILSDIAKVRLLELKKNPNHFSFNNFEEAQNYVNDMQDIHLKSDRNLKKDNNGNKTIDFNKDIGDFLDYKESMFNISLNSVLETKFEVEKIKDSLEENKNKILSKNKKNINKIRNK